MIEKGLSMKKNSREKKFKKIKKKHIWPSIVGLILVTIVVAVLSVASMALISEYMLFASVEREYASAESLVELWSAVDNSNPKKVDELVKGKVEAYVVRDDKKNIEYSFGDNTCEMDHELMVYTTDKGEILLYKDNKTLGFDSDGTFELQKSIDDFVGFQEGKISIEKNIMNPNAIFRVTPFWISISSGKREFLVKSYVGLSYPAILLLALLAGILCFLTIVIYVALVAGIVRRVIDKNKMVGLFLTDEVTRGYNWMGFVINSGQILKRKKNRRANYAIIDVNFINYRYFCMCHSVAQGEEILQKMSGIMRSMAAKRELVGHFASSNFAILLRYEDLEELTKRLKNLTAKLESVDTEHKFSFHIGIKQINDPKFENDSRKQLIDIEKEYNDASTATTTLDGSDESGIALFDNKLVEEQKWIEIVNANQQKALENEEYKVFYQPKYEPKSGELRGAEALIRWISPEFGFVSPGRIIPIFEKNGFITEIDHYMIRHVAKDQKRWLDMGLPIVPVSVNVSRAHFMEPDLAEQIRDIVDAEGAPHEFIELELTESAFFDDKNAILNTIKKLKSFGFAVSMDDFGSGYSSLNSLKDLPLDVLKLDAEFFRGDVDNDRREIIVSETIKLAKNLSMRTVAEGIEVKEQVEFLAQMGCDMIQGYYFAKPMPVEEYEEKMNL